MTYVKVKRPNNRTQKGTLNSKSPGHDGLTKEFYEHFQDHLKFYFILFP